MSTRTPSIRFAFTSLVLVALAACSNEVSLPTTSDMSDAGTGSPDTGGRLHLGAVGVSQANHGGVVSLSWGAVFLNADAQPSCQFSHDGPCDISDCTGPDTAARQVSAGTLTIASDGGASFTMVPSVRGGYEGGLGDAALFAPGEAVRVSATGADCPAFTASVRGPADVALTTPLEGFDRAHDLALEWTGGGAGLVEASFDSEGGASSAHLRCRFDPTTGRGVVPESALAHLGPCHRVLFGTNCSASVTTVSSIDVTAGDYDVTFEVDGTVQALVTMF